MKKTVTFLLLITSLISSSQVYCQPGWLHFSKIKRGFEALSVYDYYKAYHIFLKELQYKDNYVPAMYGLSVIISRNETHYYNIDTAYSYILLTKAAYPLLTSKQKLKWERYGVDSGNIAGLQDSIERKAFTLSTQINTIEEYNHYINYYKTSKKLPQAIELRDLLAFGIAEKENTYQAYKTFMEIYPSSLEFDEAKKRYELALFKTLTAPHTAQSYADFIAQYSQSPYEAMSEDSVYRLSMPGNNVGTQLKIHNYYEFVKHYPSNRNVPDAWRKIYSIFTMDGKPETFKRFQNTYPDYPFIQHADSDLILSQTVFYPAKKGVQWGYIDSTGTLRIPYQYEWADTAFFNGLAAVAVNDKLGYINKRGETVIPCVYEEADRFNKALAIVKKGGLYGIISTRGNVFVPFEYQEILDFSEGRAQVEKNNMFGFLNLLGDEVIPSRYSDATDFSEGLASVENAYNKYGYINYDGNIVIPFTYEWADKFRDSVAKVKENGKFGLIDLKGNLLIPCIYDNIGDFSDSLAMVVQDNKIGYCNKKGDMVIPLKYDFALDLLTSGNFVNGYAKVQLRKKRGFINKDGDLIISCKYEDALYFNQGLAPVMEKKKWGYINEDGKLDIPYKYKLAYAFSDSLARVTDNDSLGYIDMEGNMQIEPQFTIANDFNPAGIFKDMALVQFNGKYGLIDKTGNFIVPCIWSDIKFMQHGLLKVSISDKMAYYNLKSRTYMWQEEGFRGL